MTQGPWDGVMPGGRIHRPRGRRGEDASSAPLATDRRAPAAVARARRVTPGRRPAPRLAALTLVLAALVPAVSSADTTQPAVATVARERMVASTSLDGRVRLLSAELQLTPDQQLKVRALLEQQREEVRRLWSDTTLAPALRVSRMQGISDGTAEAIRGVLDESQRRRYIQPRQREAAVGAGGADVQSWMEKGAGR